MLQYSGKWAFHVGIPATSGSTGLLMVCMRARMLVVVLCLAYVRSCVCICDVGLAVVVGWCGVV